MCPDKLRLSAVVDLVEGLDVLREVLGGSWALEGEGAGILVVNLHAYLCCLAFDLYCSVKINYTSTRY